MKASGVFNVSLTPCDDEHSFGRMLLEKTFEGDLAATSKGQMLSERTSTEGSAGYVALEKVEGHLEGRKGSFYLLHQGIMNRGDSVLSVIVIPDSATDELVGLRGTMNIVIENGVHSYEFDYSWAD